MQDPIGVSGVQAVPKTLHSQGFLTSFKISPHWQVFGSAIRRLCRVSRRAISPCLYSSSYLQSDDFDFFSTRDMRRRGLAGPTAEALD